MFQKRKQAPKCGSKEEGKKAMQSCHCPLFIKCNEIKMCGVVEVQFHRFLTSVLNGNVWSDLLPDSFNLRKEFPISIEYETGNVPVSFLTL
jgi:hypothetical protein